DIKNIFSSAIVISWGSGEGEEAISNATTKAINLYNKKRKNLSSPKALLLHFYLNPTYPIINLIEAVEIIEKNFPTLTTIMFGVTTINSKEDRVSLTSIFIH
ncbi:MAG: hypothetical protein GXN91_05830, partial [Epsilonproteobacteria bacterium]|nr:hypothetical protein [Campylobacterota bacterium]